MMPSFQKVLSLAGGTVAAIVLVLFLGWWQVDGPGAPTKDVPTNKLPLPIDQMNFTLTADDGRRIVPADWIGQPLLVFFGFTYCPDVCPTALTEITDWLDGLGQESERINVAFITVDPERDTFQAMSAYVENFHPAITGYTGSPSDIADVARGLRAKYEKVVTGQTYTMDHTAGIFVYDAQGMFVTVIDIHEPKTTAVQKIKRAL